MDLIRITSLPVGSIGGQWTRLDENTDLLPQLLHFSLPSTQATEMGYAISRVQYNLSTTGTAPTTSPPSPLIWMPLYRECDSTATGATKNPTFRRGFNEGWAVTVDVNAAVTVKGLVKVIWTEII